MTPIGIMASVLALLLALVLLSSPAPASAWVSDKIPEGIPLGASRIVDAAWAS
jgi:hypothetical protein